MLDNWLDLVGDRLSPTTLDHYRGYAARYLKPALGSKSVRKITSRDLDRLYLAMSRDRGLAARTVRQAHAVVRGALGQAVKDTKTHQARRLSLDTTTVAILGRHRAWSAERSLACGIGQAKDAIVFSDHPAATDPWLPNTVTHRFMDLCRRAGVSGVRLHDLRHMHATQLLGANLDVRTVAGRLGHANAATTLGVYAHFLQARDQDAADVIGALLDAPVTTVLPARTRPKRVTRKAGDS